MTSGPIQEGALSARATPAPPEETRLAPMGQQAPFPNVGAMDDIAQCGAFSYDNDDRAAAFAATLIGRTIAGVEFDLIDGRASLVLDDGRVVDITANAYGGEPSMDFGVREQPEAIG